MAAADSLYVSRNLQEILRKLPLGRILGENLLHVPAFYYFSWKRIRQITCQEYQMLNK